MGGPLPVWNAGGMALPLCIVLSVVALAIAVLLFLRDRRGRGVQWVGVAALPIGLYLSGLLGLVVDGARALWAWVQQVSLSSTIGTGLGLIALTVVLWVVGGWLARRRAVRSAVARTSGAPAVGAKPSRPSAAPARPARGGQAAPADPEMDEIEALLRNRGIE